MNTIQQICSSTLEYKYTPADFKSLINSAYLIAIQEAIKSEVTVDVNESKIRINSNHLMQALIETKPSINTNDYKYFDNIYRRFQSDYNVNKTDNSMENRSSDSIDSNHLILNQRATFK